MAKRKFDPSVIKNRESAGSLSPLDFMRPMDDQVANDNQHAPNEVRAKGSRSREPNQSPKVDNEDLPMPPSKKTEARITILFRVTPDLDQRLKQFVSDHEATIQDTCTLAVEEFLDRRKA